jgi:hypothetical protein
MLELLNFMTEQENAGGLDESKSNLIKDLWNKYKENEISENCTIIEADFGRLGSMIIRKLKSFEPTNFKYEGGGYDYVSVKCDTRRILWTDYSETEPYNRQSGLYCGGMSFDMLGNPLIETETYREFQCKDSYESNISFAVWGFRFNDFYKCVRFGICIKNESVDQFIADIREIIGKPEVSKAVGGKE